jgi:hypothetical protein
MVSMPIMVLRVLTPCILRPEDGGGKFLWNVSSYLQDHTAV